MSRGVSRRRSAAGAGPVAAAAAGAGGRRKSGRTGSRCWRSNRETGDAFFGSWGLYAYDLDGELLWEVDLGDRFMRNAFGEGTTPALHGDTLVVTWDHIGGQSFVAALDARTGEERWRSNRDEIDTWATPLIVEHDGRAQAITPAMNQVYSYDLETGETVWRSRGTTMNAIPLARAR